MGVFAPLKKLLTRNNLTLLAVIALIVVIVVVYKLKIERFDGNRSVIVEYYSLPSCGHCKRFNPEWDIFESQAASDASNITATKINAGEAAGSAKAQDAGVSGYPTVKITKNDNTSDYTGARTAAALNDYINKL